MKLNEKKLKKNKKNLYFHFIIHCVSFTIQTEAAVIWNQMMERTQLYGIK